MAWQRNGKWVGNAGNAGRWGIRNQKPKPKTKPTLKTKPKPKATSKGAPKSIFNMHVRHVFLTQEK